MLAVDKAMRPSTWMPLAQRAEIVLHRDAFVHEPTNTIPRVHEGELLVPKLDHSVISEVTEKITGGAHFTFLKTGEVIRKAFPNEKLDTHRHWARAVRALELSIAEDVNSQITHNHPRFLGTEYQMYRTKLLTFKPKNPIAPHTDYFDRGVITTIMCIQELSKGESLSRTTMWNLDPEHGANISKDDLKEDDFDTIKFIKDERVADGSLESLELPLFSPEEGVVLIYSDSHLGHSASKQNSKARREVNIVDLIPDYIQSVDTAEYWRNLTESRIDFQDGENLTLL